MTLSEKVDEIIIATRVQMKVGRPGGMDADEALKTIMQAVKDSLPEKKSLQPHEGDTPGKHQVRMLVDDGYNSAIDEMEKKL
jgi:hypothetical protein